MRKLKAGIVGCGGIANGKHLPAMKKSGLYEIVAFCDIVRERAEKAKEEYGTEDGGDFRENRQSPEHRIPEPLPSRFPVSEGDVQG